MLAYFVASISLPIWLVCSSCASSRTYKLYVQNQKCASSVDAVLIVRDGTWIPLGALFRRKKEKNMVCIHVTNEIPITFEFPSSTIQVLLFDTKTSGTASGAVFRNAFERSFYTEPCNIIVENQRKGKNQYGMFLSLMTNRLSNGRLIPGTAENPTNLIRMLEWHLTHIDESYRTHEAQFRNADE